MIYSIDNIPFLALLKRSQERFALGKLRVVFNLGCKESHHRLSQFWTRACNINLEGTSST